MADREQRRLRFAFLKVCVRGYQAGVSGCFTFQDGMCTSWRRQRQQRRRTQEDDCAEDEQMLLTVALRCGHMPLLSMTEGQVESVARRWSRQRAIGSSRPLPLRSATALANPCGSPNSDVENVAVALSMGTAVGLPLLEWIMQHVPTRRLLLRECKHPGDGICRLINSAIRGGSAEATQVLVRVLNHCMTTEQLYCGELVDSWLAAACAAAAAASEPRGTSSIRRSLAHTHMQDFIERAKTHSTRPPLFDSSTIWPRACEYAAAGGDPELFEQLRADGAGFAVKKALDSAAAAGHVRMLEHVSKIVCQRRQQREQQQLQPYPMPDEAPSSDAMDFAAEHGHVHAMEWLKAAFPDSARCTASATVLAAQEGQLACLRWLQTHRELRPTSGAIGMSLLRGHGEVARFLQQFWTSPSVAAEPPTTVLNQLVDMGRVPELSMALDMLEDSSSNAVAINAAVEYAAASHRCVRGESQAIQCLRALVEHKARRASAGSKHLQAPSRALDAAAAAGNMDCVRFLTGEETPDGAAEGAGATAAAMDGAVARGDTDMVQYLHEHRTEGCTPRALTSAAAHGHLGLVELLREHYLADSAVDHALHAAVRGGHARVARYFITVCIGSLRPASISSVITAAAGAGDIDVLEALQSCELGGWALSAAAAAGQFDAVVWIMEQLRRNPPIGFRGQILRACDLARHKQHVSVMEFLNDAAKSAPKT